MELPLSTRTGQTVRVVKICLQSFGSGQPGCNFALTTHWMQTKYQSLHGARMLSQVILGRPHTSLNGLPTATTMALLITGKLSMERCPTMTEATCQIFARPSSGVLRTEANGHWYRSIETPEQIDWVVASQYSENLGGHLATLSSENESNWVKFGLANNPAGSRMSTDAFAWGHTSELAERRLEIGPGWMIPLEEVTDWHPGTPNIPAVPAAARFWDVLGNFNGYGWNDRPLDDVLSFKSFIVEWSSDCNGDGIVDLGQYL